MDEQFYVLMVRDKHSMESEVYGLYRSKNRAEEDAKKYTDDKPWRKHWVLSEPVDVDG